MHQTVVPSVKTSPRSVDSSLLKKILGEEKGTMNLQFLFTIIKRKIFLNFSLPKSINQSISQKRCNMCGSNIS